MNLIARLKIYGLHSLLLGVFFGLLGYVLINYRFIHPVESIENNVLFSDLSIEATGDKSIEAKGSEVWFYGAFRVSNGEKIIFSPLDLSSWEKRDEVYLSYKNQPSRLKLATKINEPLRLDFGSHPYSGLVRITWNGNIKIVNLYSSATEGKTVTIESGKSYQYSPLYPLIISAFVCFGILVSIPASPWIEKGILEFKSFINPPEMATNRVFGLDLLRAFAILTVVYGHGYFLIHQDFPRNIYNLLFFIDGVTYFFVLSGFLIGRILIRTITKPDFNGKMLLEFWIRRWFRTLPNYFFVLVFIIICYQYLDKPSSENLWQYFIFSQNISSPRPDFFAESWSLTIEEWFYLATPIPLYLITRFKSVNRQKAIVAWIAIIILFVTGFRVYRVLHESSFIGDWWGLYLHGQVVTRLDSMMYGVLGAYLSLFHNTLWIKYAKNLFVLGALFILLEKLGLPLFSSIYYYQYYLMLTVNPLTALLLLPYLSEWRRTSGWLASSITFISLISYSMYLLNLTPIQQIILPMILDNLFTVCAKCDQHISILRYLLYWVLTVSCSFLLYRYFEKPCTALREKWYIKNTTFATTDFKS